MTTINQIQIQAAVTASSFAVLAATDSPQTKTVNAVIRVTPDQEGERDRTASVEVWKGTEYDDAGQWTDDDLSAAIKAKLEAGQVRFGRL
jgi:hypothetical protein